VKKICCRPAQAMTALFKNSVPSSKSRPTTSNGTCSTPAFNPPRMWVWALLRTVRVKVQPVCTQAAAMVRSSLRDGSWDSSCLGNH
jgi:hypothetical protein